MVGAPKKEGYAMTGYRSAFQSRIGRRRRHKRHKERFRLLRLKGLYRPRWEPRPRTSHTCLLVGGARDGEVLEISAASRAELTLVRHVEDMPGLRALLSGEAPLQSTVRREEYQRMTEVTMQSEIPPRGGLAHDVRTLFDPTRRFQCLIAHIQILQPRGHAKMESLPPRHKRAVEEILAKKLGIW